MSGAAKSVLLILLAVLLINALGILAYFSVPESHPRRDFLVDEDGLVENLSAGMFLLAFFCGAALLLRGVHGRFDRRWTGLVTLLGLMGFLDEVSYGERIFDLKMPMLAKIKLDAAHDLIDWLYYEGPLVVARHPSLYLLGLVAVVLIASVALIRFRRPILELVRERRNYPLYALMLFFLGFLAIAVTIDLGILDPWSEELPIVEELLELSAGILLLSSSYIVYRRGRPADPPDPSGRANRP